MSFDRLAAKRRVFKAWTASQRDRLLATGIPMVAWSKLEHWWYFLEHNYLPYDVDPTQFRLEMLTPEQAAALRELLEEEPTYTGTPSIMSALRRVAS